MKSCRLQKAPFISKVLFKNVTCLLCTLLIIFKHYSIHILELGFIKKLIDPIVLIFLIVSVNNSLCSIQYCVYEVFMLPFQYILKE